MRQLQLDIAPVLDAKIGDFAGPSWAPVIDSVRQLHTGLIKHFYIYGAAGTGKSHLLSAICDSYLDEAKTAIKVSLLELLDAPVEAIHALDNYDLVALDDIEAISGLLQWQKAIFHFINLSYESKTQIVFSSRLAPTELRLQFPDLQSRLTQAVSIRVPSGQRYSDRQALLQAVMLRQGLQFEPQIVDYLLLHGPQKTATLLQTLERLQQLLQGEQVKSSNSRLKQIFALIDEYSH